MPDNKQTERVVLVTGAGGGIGTALVHRFLDNGDTVIGTDVSAEALHTLETGLATAGPALVTQPADITSPEDVNALAETAQRAGGLDILVNCAGFFPFDTFDNTTLERWRAVIEVNLTSYYLVTHTLLPLMREHGWGRIVNFGSASMYPGVAGQVHYVSAKSAMMGFTRSLAREVGEDGITVNMVTPGVTLTGPVVEHFAPELIEAQRTGRAVKRDQHAADLVGPVFFLASPDADFVTGQTLNVDGGMFMN